MWYSALQRACSVQCPLHQRLGFGRGQAIWRTGEGVPWGGSDPRGDGCAPGVPG